jgi:hypothetical protein
MNSIDLDFNYFDNQNVSTITLSLHRIPASISFSSHKKKWKIKKIKFNIKFEYLTTKKTNYLLTKEIWGIKIIFLMKFEVVIYFFCVFHFDPLWFDFFS